MLPKPITSYHLSLFGFPYYRHWQEVADYLDADKKSTYYSTNERTTMPEYYIDMEKNSGKIGYYIYIHHPQKLIDGLDNKRVIRYAYSNEPARVFKNGDKTVTEIYLLPQGSPSIPKEEFEKYGVTETSD